MTHPPASPAWTTPPAHDEVSYHEVSLADITERLMTAFGGPAPRLGNVASARSVWRSSRPREGQTKPTAVRRSGARARTPRRARGMATQSSSQTKNPTPDDAPDTPQRTSRSGPNGQRAAGEA